MSVLTFGVMMRDRSAGLGTGVVTAKLLYDLYNLNLIIYICSKESRYEESLYHKRNCPGQVFL